MNEDSFEVCQIAECQPMIHINGNNVTLHEVVSAVLAVGGTAIGSSSSEEAKEITNLSDGLVLNIGTPDLDRKKAMLLSGQQANKKGIPVVLDPVGAGASEFRKSILTELLQNVHFACIRGNNSELAAIYKIAFSTDDYVRSGGVEDAGSAILDEQMQELAARYNTVIATSAAEDRIVSADNIYKCTGGTRMMRKITGAGCMQSGVIAAGLAAYWKNQAASQRLAESDASAIHTIMQRYKDDALRAYQTMQRDNKFGIGSFLNDLLDQLCTWSSDK